MERIPILRMGRLLLVTIQVDMHDRLAMTLQDDLTTRIVTDRAAGVLIDISALDIVDSFIGRMISNTAAMATRSALRFAGINRAPASCGARAAYGLFRVCISATMRRLKSSLAWIWLNAC